MNTTFILVGSRKRQPRWRCLRLFAPAEVSTGNSHGENSPDTGKTACGIDGINIRVTKIDDTVTNEIVVTDKRKSAKGSERGVVLGMGNSGPYVLAVTATTNQGRRTVATVIKEIHRSLNLGENGRKALQGRVGHYFPRRWRAVVDSPGYPHEWMNIRPDIQYLAGSRPSRTCWCPRASPLDK